jgi:hypothetical protein
MSRLFGTEEWNQAALREKVGYLLDSMSDVDDLARTFTPGVRPEIFGPENERPMNVDARDVRLEQFTEATALLLVSDDVRDARQLFADPGWVLSGHSTGDSPNGFGVVDTNVRQFVRLSLFAALARQGKMRGTGEELSFATERGYLRLSWSGESEREFTSVLPTLYSIAVASKSEPETLYFLADLINGAWERFIDIDLFERPEFQLLGIYGIPEIAKVIGIGAPNPFGPLDGFLALRELERQYTFRIRQMRNDSYHWNRLNPAGDLVDWVLLITEVAALRSGFKLFFPDDALIAPESRFCWDLAKTLT